MEEVIKKGKRTYREERNTRAMGMDALHDAQKKGDDRIRGTQVELLSWHAYLEDRVLQMTSGEFISGKE